MQDNIFLSWYTADCWTCTLPTWLVLHLPICVYVCLLLVMPVCRCGSCAPVSFSVLSRSIQRWWLLSWTAPIIVCLLRRQQDESTRSTALTRSVSANAAERLVSNMACWVFSAVFNHAHSISHLLCSCG